MHNHPGELVDYRAHYRQAEPGWEDEKNAKQPQLPDATRSYSEDENIECHLETLKNLQRSLTASLAKGAAKDIALLMGRELDIFAFIIETLPVAHRINALALVIDAAVSDPQQKSAASLVAGLTPRQRQIMELVLAGEPSKNIAADLGISQRTVENHRAVIMRKTCSRSVPALARLAVAASLSEMKNSGGHLSA